VTVIGYTPDPDLSRPHKFVESENWRQMLNMILYFLLPFSLGVRCVHAICVCGREGRVADSQLLQTMAKSRGADGFLHLIGMSMSLLLLPCYIAVHTLQPTSSSFRLKAATILITVYRREESTAGE